MSKYVPHCGKRDYTRVEGDSRLSTRNFLITHEIIDSFDKVLNQNELFRASNWLLGIANDKYGYYTELPFKLKKDGLHVDYNEAFFKKVDGVKLQIEKKKREQEEKKRIEEERKRIIGEQGDLFNQEELGNVSANIKPGVQELFDENPELANAVYEALGFDNTIKPTDKIIWGHPAIGKSYAAKKVKMIDFDSYKLGINRKYNLYIAPGLSDTELRTDDKTREARENWRYESEENQALWNQFIRDSWQQAKKDAEKQKAILFASDLLVLREFGNEVDKALTMPDELFFERSKQRNNFIEGPLGTKVWKGNLNKAVANFKEKFGENKVINTEKYLSDLFITPQQKQQAQQLYSNFLSNFINSNFDTIIQDLESKNILNKKCS